VLLFIAVLLAIFLLPSPWGIVVIVVAGVIELTEVGVGLWWNRRRTTRVGLETLVGKRAVALDELRPDGQVKVGGEIWRAHCAAGSDAGAEVVVLAADGLLLEVEPA
jgi:membrane protein implicated in regulation of membrane protease activity